MYKIDLSKLGKVETVNDDLTARYGEIGTESRIEFDAKAKAWYLAECLKEARRKAGMTQAWQEMDRKHGFCYERTKCYFCVSGKAHC